MPASPEPDSQVRGIGKVNTITRDSREVQVHKANCKFRLLSRAALINYTLRLWVADSPSFTQNPDNMRHVL